MTIKIEDMKTKLKGYMDSAEATTYMIALLDPALASWNGKQVTKRIIPRLRTYINEDFRLWLRKTYSGMELTMSKGTKTLNVILCSLDNKTFNMDLFRQKHEYLYKQMEKYNKYAEATVKVNEWYEDYMTIRQDVIDLKAKMNQYECEYLIDWYDLRYTG